MREQRKIMTALALTMLAVLLLVVMAAAVQGAPAAERPEGWSEHQVTAHNVAQQMRAMGYDEDNIVIIACQEWWRAERENGPSQSERGADSEKGDPAEATASVGRGAPSGSREVCGLPETEKGTGGSDDGASQDSYVSDAKRQAYPVAARVWTLLREAGLSEACTAGIIGNMMSECGGQTLNLAPGTYSGGYYGLCMWSLYYFPEADRLGVDDQVALLLRTLESNISAGGGSCAAFMASADARTAARYFSDYYERPAVWSEVRADNAERALEYFGG